MTPQKSLRLQHWLPGQEVPPAGFPQAPPGAARPAFNFAGGGDGVVVGGGAEGDEVEEADLQEPKWRWQPAPQWAAVTPQKPFLLQHWLSGHEAPPLEPQAPPGAAVPPLPDCRSSRPPAHKELKCQLNRARKPLMSYVERVKLASKSKNIRLAYWIQPRSESFATHSLAKRFWSMLTVHSCTAHEFALAIAVIDAVS